MSEWKTIESAPRDDERVLVARIAGDGQIDYMYVAWSKRKRWRIFEGINGDYRSLKTEPTHWMPLPAPPAECVREGE